MAPAASSFGVLGLDRVEVAYGVAEVLPFLLEDHAQARTDTELNRRFPAAPQPRANLSAAAKLRRDPKRNRSADLR